MNRKGEILRLAVELVRNRGFDSFSYADLASELGIRKASIHHHYPRKEDLGLSVLEAVTDYLRARYQEIDETSASAWERLERMFNLDPTSRQERQSAVPACPLASMQASSSSISPAMREQLAVVGRLEMDFLTSILERGRAAGEMQFKGSAQAQARLLLAALKGSMFYGRIHGETFFEDSMRQAFASLRPS